MAMFKEITITGLDTDRPPRIRKLDHVDLVYKLSEEAPEEWCEEFRHFGRALNPQAKVDKVTRCYIKTYVTDMDAIPAHLEVLERAVFDCNTQYMETLRQRALNLLRQEQRQGE